MSRSSHATLKGVLFDLDGTLVSSELDFDLIRREAGIVGEPILEHMERADPQRRRRVNEILERHEDEAALRCRLAAGVAELFELVRRCGLGCGIITRNSRRTVDIVTQRHGLQVDVVIAREDAVPKPSPAPVEAACRALGIRPHEALVVGDFRFDMEAGQAAGARTALVRLPGKDYDGVKSDYAVGSLAELLPIVEALADGSVET